jgi:hypothetical protein
MNSYQLILDNQYAYAILASAVAKGSSSCRLSFRFPPFLRRCSHSTRIKYVGARLLPASLLHSFMSHIPKHFFTLQKCIFRLISHNAKHFHALSQKTPGGYPFAFFRPSCPFLQNRRHLPARSLPATSSMEQIFSSHVITSTDASMLPHPRLEPRCVEAALWQISDVLR